MKRYRMTKGRRGSRTLLTALAGALVATSLAACGQGSGGSAGGGVPDTFRYAYSYDIPTWDPMNLTNPTQDIYLFPVYDRLVHLTPDSQPMPGMASSWEYSEDAKTLTMTLEEGITFSDGETFDSTVAKDNLDRYRTTETSSLAVLLKSIDTIDTPDPQTLVINLSEPDGTLLVTLAERAGMMISPAALDSGTLDTNPVGAGQYTLVSHQANDRVTYERRDDYWNPELEGEQNLEIRIMSDANARANALKSNEVDAAGVPIDQVGQFDGNDDFVVDAGATTYYYGMIYGHDIFKDVRIREALALAIDRDAIVDAVLKGYGEPMAQQWAEGTFAYNPDIKPEYNPEKSKQLLAEANFPEDFEFEAVVPMVDPGPKVAEAVQQMYAEVGVTMNIKVLDAAQIVDNFFVQHQGDAYLGALGGQPSQLAMAEQTLLPGSYYKPLEMDEPEVVKLFEEANAETDPDAQQKIIQEMTAEIHKLWLNIPIASSINPMVLSTRVEGYERYTNGLIEFPNVTVNVD